MTAVQKLDHRFVEAVPSELVSGILYVSLEYATMMHLCCCGCGNEVVTPLSPSDWKMTYDGQTVSVQPSIGSWSLPCRSHYVIRRGRVNWANDWNDEQIAKGRARDQSIKASVKWLEEVRPETVQIPPENRKSWWASISRLFAF
jgi:hypothetical protein